MFFDAIIFTCYVRLSCEALSSLSTCFLWDFG